MNSETYIASSYEKRYQAGYGLLYPESHIIRIHRQILEWELGLVSGGIFDFGCGSGANLRYFVDQGFLPYGCDTSETAINRCRELMPEYSERFVVCQPDADLGGVIPKKEKVEIFLSNQVFQYLRNDQIRRLTQQAYNLVRPGGVIVATMMASSGWYMRYSTGREGDFHRVELQTPRQNLTTLINFKERDELEELFSPFRKLHIGSYGSWIREEEGSTDHWIFVGIRD